MWEVHSKGGGYIGIMEKKMETTIYGVELRLWRSCWFYALAAEQVLSQAHTEYGLESLLMNCTFGLRSPCKGYFKLEETCMTAPIRVDSVRSSFVRERFGF